MLIITFVITAIIVGICAYITSIELKENYYTVEFISQGSILNRHYVSARDRKELMHRLLQIRKIAYKKFRDDELIMHIVSIDRNTYEKETK